MQSPKFTHRMQPPGTAEVIALRLAVQANGGLGITAAQDYCAAQLHTTRRVWQQWETGDRGMHPAFFELATLKLRQQP